MPLTFEKEINLTEYEGNPSPKVVEQLAIVHESQQGDISQYYIVPVTKQAGDKASLAIGIKHERTNNTPAYYTYDDYDELTWNTKKGSRITRQRIDRLGVKAFPNVGAIAHYKLTYRNLSRILAPVNYVTHKYKSPILSAELHETYIHFTITPPDTSNTSEEDLIEYQVYRICMQWNQFTLEYVTYDLEYDVPLPPTTGTYSCWCIGYVNEGEACSNDSNTIDLDIQGTRSDWPNITPGSEDIYIKQMYFNENGYLIGVLTNGDSVQSGNHLPINLSELHDVSLTNVLAHQLIHYNDDTEKWENYTSAVPTAAEGIARILDVTVDNLKQITIKTNNLLKANIDTTKCIIKVGNTSKTITSITTLTNTKARVILSEAITESFTVQLLVDAFKASTNNTNVYEVEYVPRITEVLNRAIDNYYVSSNGNNWLCSNYGSGNYKYKGYRIDPHITSIALTTVGNSRTRVLLTTFNEDDILPKLQTNGTISGIWANNLSDNVTDYEITIPDTDSYTYLYVYAGDTLGIIIVEEIY